MEQLQNLYPGLTMYEISARIQGSSGPEIMHTILQRCESYRNRASYETSGYTSSYLDYISRYYTEESANRLFRKCHKVTRAHFMITYKASSNMSDILEKHFALLDD